MTIPTPVEFWNLNGTLVGAVAGTVLASDDGNDYFVDGKIGQGWNVAYFISRRLYLDDPQSRGIAGNAPWSFSVWRRSANTENNSGSYLGLHAAAGGSAAIDIVDSKSAFGWTTQVLFSGTQKISKAAAKDANWHHVVVTYSSDDGGTLQVFHDGEKSIATGVGSPSLVYDRLTISFSNGINGVIDAAGWWDVVLSDAEVAELYNAGDGWEYTAAPPGPTEYAVLTINEGPLAGEYIVLKTR